jgi:Ca-activated chloride channel family protein
MLLSAAAVRAHRIRLALCLVAALIVGAFPAVGQDTPASRNLERARTLLDEGMSPTGGLDVLAELVPEGDISGGGSRAELAVQVSDLAMSSDAASWVLSFVAMQVDEYPLVRHVRVEWPTGAGGRGWVFSTTINVPPDFQDAAVVVEDMASGRWGGTWVELTDEASPRPPGFVVLTERDRPEPVEPRPKPPPPALPRAEAPEEQSRSPVIRLVAPAGRPVVGRARFRTIVTTGGVEKVVFYLDGTEVASDEREPFSAVIDVGKEPSPHEIRVEAFGGLHDLRLGSDTLEINVDARPFSVAISELADGGTGEVVVRVDLSVPADETLAKLEFFRNEDLVATVDRPPFEASVRAADSGSDFIRVLATLSSGEALEDAQILAPGIISERVEVNLVEVYAVVTDKSGTPVTDLEVDDFSLRIRRRDVPIERFALADEVPLVLGLIVDSSESMYPLMVETRSAAGSFFSSTLKESDRGFLVDFDSQPRLAQGLTGELGVLLQGLRALRPGGNTAIYDATMFSFDQFESQPGRRALVLLTDGRDYGSRFSPRRCVQEARRLGVPIYVIVLNNLGFLPNSWQQGRQQEPPPVDASLETLVLQTGGRLFNLAGTEDLGDVYATINAELRSQYLLAFSTEERLEEKELAAVKVDVEGKGLEVRTVTLDR